MLNLNQKPELNAITQDLKHVKRSKRYHHVKTHDLVKTLESHGFSIAKTWQAMPRKAENQGFQKHIVSLYHQDYQNVNGLRPEIILKNSHAGDQSLIIDIGIFRWACSNGLVAITKFSEAFRLRHDATDFDYKFGKALDIAMSEFSRIVNRQVKTYSSLELTDVDQIDLARDMIIQRIGLDGYKESIVDFNTLTRPLRDADKSNDLFTVFNRVQEKLNRGFVIQRAKTRVLQDGTRQPYLGIQTLKAFKSQASENQFQKQLWSTMDSFYQSKVA